MLVGCIVANARVAGKIASAKTPLLRMSSRGLKRDYLYDPVLRLSPG